MADDHRTSRPNLLIATWGIVGFLALLGQALWRLAPMAIEPIEDGTLSGLQIAIYVLWVLFMAYSEGYKGFQKQLAPRMSVRAMLLARRPQLVPALLAPMYCMGLFHASKKRLIIAWSVFIGVILLVLLVRQLDQPWRGIVDGGVVVGLLWGSLSILWYFIRTLGGHPPDVSPDLPEGSPLAPPTPAAGDARG